MLRLITLLSLGVVGAYFFGRFGASFWLADLFSHWQGQYMVAMCVFFLGFARYKKRIRAVLAGLFCVYLSLPFWTFGSDDLEEVDLLFLNALYVQEQIGESVSLISDIEPSMVSIVELNESLYKGIIDLGYKSLYYHQNKFESFGFFVREDADIDNFRADIIDAFPYPIGRVESPYGVIYTIHPFPGMLPVMWESMDIHFGQVSEVLKNELSGYTLVGDFNSTVFSPLFQKYFGQMSAPVRYTWHRKQLYRLPIDHVLSTKEVSVQVGQDVGSDHRPLLVGF